MKKNLLFLFCFCTLYFAHAQQTPALDSNLNPMEVAKEKTVEVFPNPVVDRVTITAAATIESYKLYNVLGTLVMQGTTNSRKNILDLTDLHSGAYLLEVNTGTTKTTLKIIKR